LDNSYSRIVWFDLNETTHALRAEHATEGTVGWQPHSVRVLQSEDGYDDELQIEAIWFGQKFCSGKDTFQGVAGARTIDPTDGRTDVSIGIAEDVSADCVYGTLPNARAYLQRNSACASKQYPIVAGETLEPFPSQAGCMMLVLAADSRKALLDEFTQTGRRADRPVRVEVNFSTVVDPGYSTVFTEEGAGPTPVVPVTIAYGAPIFNVTSVSCGLSRVVRENHARDMVLQDEQDEMVRTRVLRDQASGAAAFLERTAASKAAYLPPSSPPPPPPLPPPSIDASSPGYPPAPPSEPKLITIEEEIDKLEARAAVYQDRINELELLILSCNPSRDETCGRTSTEAPDPWLGENGERCRGYSTRETREGDYCGFWQSTVIQCIRTHCLNPPALTIHLCCFFAQVNPDGADADELDDLLERKPYCLGGDDGITIIQCSELAQRTARSGVYELWEWKREDRRYNEFEFFLSREAEAGTPSAEYGRAQMVERNASCHTNECSTCTQKCTVRKHTRTR
tara:strand:+ start:49 stop:1584 length:1536 start_codon:yes stop_codon:yes gene_type:complete